MLWRSLIQVLTCSNTVHLRAMIRSQLEVLCLHACKTSTIIILLHTALVRPLLEPVFSLGHDVSNETAKLERVQWKAAELIKGLGNEPCKRKGKHWAGSTWRKDGAKKT